MLLRKTWFIFLILSALSDSLQGQIFGPDADYAFNAQYDKTPDGSDKVFVFNRETFMAEKIASIVAVSTDSLSGWDFEWSVFEHADTSYKIIPATETGMTSVIDTITIPSGYRVIMKKGAEADTFRAWIIFNDLDVFITNKDEADTLLFGYYNCASLDLRADTTKPFAYYYNPVTAVKSGPGNIYTIRWTTDNSDASAPAARLVTRVTNPPWKDTWYVITITDNFGLQRSDSVFYESIQPLAKLAKPEYIPLGDSVEYPDKPWLGFFYEGDQSAPGKFRFDLSESENFIDYELEFGDGDSILLSADSLHLVHEYKKPGNYKVVLTVKGEAPYECLDSISDFAELVFASEENFIVPNVFAPGSNTNEVFKVDPNNINGSEIFRTDDVSVIFIDIAIFSRTGLKMHEFEGNIRDWTGWDGTIMNSGREAPTGVYFYVISRFQAYQDPDVPEEQIDKKLMNGFIHLYRK